MNEEKEKFLKSLIVPVIFILLIWLIKFFEVLSGISLGHYGIYPRHFSNIFGIISAPFLHANFQHLFSNSLPVLFLSVGIIYFYKVSAFRVILFIYLVTGILVWIIARSSYHIGASGLIYGFVSYLFFSGIIRRDKRAVTLALLVTFLYGSLVWGIFPLQRDVSWESHLFGSFSGIAAAFIFRKYDPYKKYEWEDEPEETPPGKLEISYKKDIPPEKID